jgi:hypothetical protein
VTITVEGTAEDEDNGRRRGWIIFKPMMMTMERGRGGKFGCGY